jgi:4-hydroxy-tetrahydrodipicolinate reductase
MAMQMVKQTAIYKIGLLGATGRMGLEIASLLSSDYSLENSHLELADAVAEAGTIVSVEGVDVRSLSEPAREPVHAWVDYSRPEATMKLLTTIDTPILIGTTGFTPEQLAKIAEYAERHPVILTSNSSPGMNTLFALLEQLSPLDWIGEVAVTEVHHRQKKDAPSGTAKELARILVDRGLNVPDVQVTRAGSVPGTHTVYLYGYGEEIMIQHRVTERKVFAEGALRGIVYLLRQKRPGFYHLTRRDSL